MEILKVQKLCKTYGTGEAKVDALKKVSFSLEKGEFAAVVGESGSGKSTLLNCIGALDVPTSGSVAMDGNNLFSIVLGQRENVPVKPDPAIIEDILTFTAIPKSETLYVGDSGVDMQTARNSALTSIGVTWGFRPRRELEVNGANFIADSPEEITVWINTRTSTP